MAANFKCTNVHKYTLLYLFILEKSCYNTAIYELVVYEVYNFKVVRIWI